MNFVISSKKRSNGTVLSLLPAPLDNLDLIVAFYHLGIMGRRKTQKIVRTGPKNVTTGMCPECRTIGRIFLLGQPGEERGKCEKCRQEFEI